MVVGSRSHSFFKAACLCLLLAAKAVNAFVFVAPVIASHHDRQQPLSSSQHACFQPSHMLLIPALSHRRPTASSLLSSSRRGGARSSNINNNSSNTLRLFEQQLNRETRSSSSRSSNVPARMSAASSAGSSGTYSPATGPGAGIIDMRFKELKTGGFKVFLLLFLLGVSIVAGGQAVQRFTAR